MIKILPNTEKNFETIRTIAEIVWPVTYGTILSKEQLDFMFEIMYDVHSLHKQANERKHHFVIAYQDDTPLGFASYEFNCEKTNKTKVHKIYILPNQQGKGIGKALIDYIFVESKKQKSQTVYLNVNRFNAAKDFYLKIGFSIIKEEDIAIGNGFLMEDYVMEKSI
jgi:diamine N-acetyltransferase